MPKVEESVFSAIHFLLKWIEPGAQPSTLAQTDHHFWMEIQAISKMQITFKDKARADEKAEHTCEYVSILKRFATP